MEAMDACVSPSPCTFLDESPAGISSRRRQSDIRRLKVLSNTSSFSDAMKKHSRSRNATHLCSVCFGDEVSSAADSGNTMEIVLHSQALYPTRRLVRSVSTPTAWKGGLFCTCNINKFYISSNNNSTTNETSVVKSDAEPMLHESKEEMSINVTDIKTQASVAPLADNERTGASEGLTVASTVTEKVDVEVVVEEHKQKNTIPHSRPSKGIALPRANSESILLLKDPCPPHGTMSIIGRRREMEDTVAAVPSFISLSKPPVPSHNGLTGFTAPTPTPLHFFGVYDGHGGSQVSTYCKNRFHEALAEELGDAASSTRDLSYWNKVMSACFMKMDMAVGGMCPNGGCSSNGDVQMISDCCQDPVAPENVGSTAVVAVVSPTQVVIANCGDSRAVLCRGGKAIPLSNDHKPEREDELGRIEAAGGRVIYWNGYRVGGFLAMSRALGDRFLKKYVISEPEVTCTERTHEDECLILASDGLWDVLSNDTVCEVARKCLAGFRPHRSKGITEDTPVGAAAALLTKLALGRGSGDNISVVVIDLKERRNRNR